MKILDFQRQSGNINSILIHKGNFCCISWSTKKEACNTRRMFMEQSGNIPIFNILEHYFRISPRNIIVNFFRIYWKYLGRGCPPNIPRTFICLVSWRSISKLYLKRDFKIGIFVWILWIIQEHLFRGGFTNSRFWNTSVGSLFNKVASLTSWRPLTVLERKCS